jgi:HlyD family secretion protein
VFTISSTIVGHLERINLKEGDSVAADTTVLASIHPLDAPFLDVRTQSELAALADAAAAAVALAKVESEQAVTAVNLAESTYRRARKLKVSDSISDSELEGIYGDLQLKRAQLESTKANIQVRSAELARVQAQLSQPDEISPDVMESNCCIKLLSPIDGIVLKVFTKSEQAVAAGAPLIEVGEPQNLEVTLDLLSSDAVAVQPGTPVTISEWGGDETLSATVARVEPAAFTKVSALGIEEQRVKVEVELKKVPQGLGHGYRVLARLVVWESENVLKLPIGALFRANGNWSVFVERNGRATLQAVTIDHMNDAFAEVIEGVAEGDRIVLYPSDRVVDNTLVQDRDNSEG